MTTESIVAAGTSSIRRDRRLNRRLESLAKRLGPGAQTNGTACCVDDAASPARSCSPCWTAAAPLRGTDPCRNCWQDSQHGCDMRKSIGLLNQSNNGVPSMAKHAQQKRGRKQTRRRSKCDGVKDPKRTEKIFGWPFWRENNANSTPAIIDARVTKDLSSWCCSSK